MAEGVRVDWPVEYAGYNHVEIHDEAWFTRRAIEDAERKRGIEEKRAELAQEREAHTALVNTATGLRKAVLELHSPEEANEGGWYNGCSGCGWGAYAENVTAWPCETYELVKGWPADD